MNTLKVLHTADTHFSNKADKLTEVITTSNFILEQAKLERPDVAVIAGDVVDEHDGPIRIDSGAARAAIRFVTELANICPVVIVRGTRSHDRETPYLFAHLAGRHAIHVAAKIEQVALLSDNTFITIGEDMPCMDGEIKAAFTLIPSPDKSNLLATSGCDTIASGTMIAKEALSDMLGYLGSVNAQIVPEGVPRIMVAHGMITGSQFSTGSIATGEDFEYCLSDLALSNCDAKLFGHVHKFQLFPGNVFYSGSPGRLNMGETETKGFLVHSFAGCSLVDTQFIETPARRFLLHETLWTEEGGIEAILDQIAACEAECNGAEVRIRYSIPEEQRHQVNKEEIAARLRAAGARLVKIEPTIIPMVTQRAAGISQKDDLLKKLDMYGDVSNIKIPERTRIIAMTIESRDVDELIADALRAITSSTVEAELPEPTRTVAPTLQPVVAADQYHDADQFDLFG